MAGRPKRREQQRRMEEAIANAAALAAGREASGDPQGAALAAGREASGGSQSAALAAGEMPGAAPSGASEPVGAPEKEAGASADSDSRFCQNPSGDPEGAAVSDLDTGNAESGEDSGGAGNAARGAERARKDGAIFGDASDEGNANAVFETAEELFEAVNGYFAECDRKKLLYGEAGLCLYLSRHNRKNRPVTVDTLRRWYDGERCPYLQDTARYAYMQIQNQIETDPRYQAKGGMVTKAIFLLKQTRLGGYQDKTEEKHDVTVKLIHDNTIDDSLFE